MEIRHICRRCGVTYKHFVIMLADLTLIPPNWTRIVDSFGFLKEICGDCK